MMFAPFSLLALLVIGLLAALIIPAVWRAFAALGSIRSGTVELECPACGRQTPANHPTCKHCGQELR
jgi:uncharacterized paraquat-inducible protein A